MPVSDNRPVETIRVAAAASANTSPRAWASAAIALPAREAALRGEWNPRRLIDLARRAERLGFHSVWTGDSLLATPRPEPLTLLSAIATATSTITVGTAALLAPMRHPLLAAHSIATLELFDGWLPYCPSTKDYQARRCWWSTGSR